jgi:FAD/FMN-containing dehydrogenase
MTEITINLVPVPRHTGLVLLDFPDLYQSHWRLCRKYLATGPSAVELLDDLSLKLCLGVPEYARLLASVVSGMPHSLLVVEYAGDTDGLVLDGIDRLKQILKNSHSDIGQTIALTQLSSRPSGKFAGWGWGC